jgi:hypothetical protein
MAVGNTLAYTNKSTLLSEKSLIVKAHNCQKLATKICTYGKFTRAVNTGLFFHNDVF